MCVNRKGSQSKKAYWKGKTNRLTGDQGHSNFSNIPLLQIQVFEWLAEEIAQQGKIGQQRENILPGILS